MAGWFPTTTPRSGSTEKQKPQALVPDEQPLSKAPFQPPRVALQVLPWSLPMATPASTPGPVSDQTGLLCSLCPVPLKHQLQKRFLHITYKTMTQMSISTLGFDSFTQQNWAIICRLYFFPFTWTHFNSSLKRLHFLLFSLILAYSAELLRYVYHEDAAQSVHTTWNIVGIYTMIHL